MRSNLPLIIFALFFGATFVVFLIMRKREEEEESKDEVPADEAEPTEVEEGS